MADSKTFVIVGGGLGGSKAAEALREKGFDGKVVLLADEEYLPYERPPLSKEFLAGQEVARRFHRARLRVVPGQQNRSARRHRGDVDRPEGSHRHLFGRHHRRVRQVAAGHRIASAMVVDSGCRVHRGPLPAQVRRRVESEHRAAGRVVAGGGRGGLDRAGGRGERPRSATSTSRSSRPPRRR